MSSTTSHHMDQEKIRLDKYLWCIRIFKTRSLATEYIEKGRVKKTGETVKASRAVKLGDVYQIKAEHRDWIIEVKGFVNTRKAYAEAVQYYTDLTPPEDKVAPAFSAPSFHTGKRLSKIGRPTKKQRRSLDEMQLDNDSTPDEK